MGVVFEGEHAQDRPARRDQGAQARAVPRRTRSSSGSTRRRARSTRSATRTSSTSTTSAATPTAACSSSWSTSRASRCRRGSSAARSPWAEAFPILEQTLRALKAAHDKGFVHRDLKPDNIWLKKTDGARRRSSCSTSASRSSSAATSPEKLTQTGSVMGTPHYMSPEQINGASDVDLRTDIYAMGVITYEMFAGMTPFVGDTLQAIMTGHLFTEPPRLADVPSEPRRAGAARRDHRSHARQGSGGALPDRRRRARRSRRRRQRTARRRTPRRCSRDAAARARSRPPAADARSRLAPSASPRRGGRRRRGGVLIWPGDAKPTREPSRRAGRRARAAAVAPSRRACTAAPRQPIDYDAVRQRRADHAARVAPRDRAGGARRGLRRARQDQGSSRRCRR